MLFIPATGPMIELRHKRWLLLLQQGAQCFGEERMVAVPGSGVIQRTDEEVFLEQGCELPLATRLSSNALAERPSESLQDAGPEQKALHLRWLPHKDLFTHIIQEKAMSYPSL